jgi:4-hydroxybenzoate polyprenyltransferase
VEKGRYGRRAVLVLLYLNTASAAVFAVAGLMMGQYVQWVVATAYSITLLLVASWVHTGHKPWQKDTA